MSTCSASSERSTSSLLAGKILFSHWIDSLHVDASQPGLNYLPQSDFLSLAAKHRGRCVPVACKQGPTRWAVWDKHGNGSLKCPSFCQGDNTTTPGKGERFALQWKGTGVGGVLGDVQLSRYN